MLGAGNGNEHFLLCLVTYQAKNFAKSISSVGFLVGTLSDFRGNFDCF
jgi:hypothetical protein